MIRAYPSRYADLAIYHFERLLVGSTERAAKTDDYERVSPGVLLPDGRGLNDTYYYPEEQGELRLSSVPSVDHVRIESVLDAATVGLQSPSHELPVVSRSAPNRVWGQRTVGEGAYGAKLELLKPFPKTAQVRSVFPRGD